MIIKYKGFVLEVNREESLDGYRRIYFYVYRQKDQKEFDTDFYPETVTVREAVKDLKFIIDEYLKHPEHYNYNL